MSITNNLNEECILSSSIGTEQFNIKTSTPGNDLAVASPDETEPLMATSAKNKWSVVAVHPIDPQNPLYQIKSSDGDQYLRMGHGNAAITGLSTDEGTTFKITEEIPEEYTLCELNSNLYLTATGSQPGTMCQFKPHETIPQPPGSTEPASQTVKEQKWKFTKVSTGQGLWLK